MATNSKNPAGALDDEESLHNVVKILLRGIGANCAREDSAEHGQFCTRLKEISDYLEYSAPDATQQAEAAIRALQDYNLRVEKRRRLRSTELGSIIHLLLKTLEDLSIASPARMQQLKAVEGQVASAKDAEELRTCKSVLADCLAEVRREAERHLTGSDGDSDRDAATNLEGRSAAEAALAAACTSEALVCGAVLVVTRLQMCNRRYGHEVGDKVLRFFAEYVKKSLAPGASIYRWTGPALLLLIPGPLDKVQAEVRALLDTRLQYECETGSRTILMAVDATWSAFPMMVDPRLVINKIDAFVA